MFVICVLAVIMGVVFLPVAASLMAYVFYNNAIEVAAMFPEAVLSTSTEILGKYPFQVIILFVYAAEILLFMVRSNAGFFFGFFSVSQIIFCE
jgi:hypothetical protein